MKRSFLKKGLASLLVASSFGCATISEEFKEASVLKDPLHEIFRSNKEKNERPIKEVKGIDYSTHDEQNKRVIVNERSYPAEDSPMREDVEIPDEKKIKIPELNTYALLTNNGENVIITYRARNPVPDLIANIRKQIPESIVLEEFQNQNALILSGKRTDFGDFKDLSNIINTFDIPPDTIRIRMQIVEYFADNTYDRDLSLRILRDMMPAFSIVLPSGSDPSKLLGTGVDLNPFINHNQDPIYDPFTNSYDSRRFSFEGAIKFLDSYGKTDTLADVDLLTSNGKPVELRNQNEIPYTETVITGISAKESLVYKNVGIDAKITPYANEEGFITLKIEKAESGERSSFEGTAQRPIFRVADYVSEIIVREGQTYYAAHSNFTRYRSVGRGIPGINRMPIFKNFGTSSQIEKNYSQLLYFIEARVLPRDTLVGTPKKE